MTTQANEEVVIRNASKDDLPQIWELFQEAFRLEAPSQSQLEGFLERCPHGMLVAQVGGELAAAQVVFIRGVRPHFYGTVVAPKFRTHRGVGTKLAVTQLSNWKKLGHVEMDTVIRCDNAISIRTAEKLDFKHVQTMRNFFSYPKRSARLYVKSLADDGKISESLGLKDRAKELWAQVVEPRLSRGLKVAWFDAWDNVLDNALHELPEMEGCPHELFRLTMQNPSSTRKRTALVMEGDGPVAVLGLREKGRHWVPALQGILPASIGPAREGYLFPALKALNLDVRIGDWPSPPPKSAGAREATPVALYNIDCQSDYEGYWRRSHYMETIRDARKRTEAFTFEVDRPGSAALTIANWAEKWQDHPDQQTIVAADMAVAAEYWGQRDRWHSFLLLDGDVPVAGMTGAVHGKDLLLTVSFRDPKYDRQYVGTRILDLIVKWAADHAFARVQLGGWYSYKAKWAPQDGERWGFRICPLRQHLREQAVWKARAIPGKLIAPFGWLPGLSRAGKDRDAGEQPQETESGAGPIGSTVTGGQRGRGD